jgi:hypothetical protein
VLCTVIWYNTVREINKVNKFVQQEGVKMDMVVALTRSVTAATERHSVNSFADSQKEAEESAVFSHCTTESEQHR